MARIVSTWLLLLVHGAIALKTLGPGPVVLPLLWPGAAPAPPHRHGIQAAARRSTTRSGVAGTMCSSRQISALGGSSEHVDVVRLKDLSATEYVGVLGVGSNCSSGRCVPATELYVVFDTGSADVWVASDLCNYGPCTMQGRHRFNRSTSSTFRQERQPQSFVTEYATGSLSGVLGTDDLWLGQVRAERQQIGLIAEESGSAFLTMPIDGIVGLGFQPLASTERALMDTLVTEKFVQHLEFAFFFFQDVSKGGALIWGHSEQLQLHRGSLRWFPVAEERYWSVPLRGFRLGRNSTTELLHLLLPYEMHPGDGPMVQDDGGLLAKAQVILDSGTTFFTAPPRLFNQFMDAIQPTSCDRIHTFPELVFSVGTDLKNRSAVYELVISPEVYMVRDPWDNHCEPGFMNLAGLPEDPPMMILGEVFMRHYLTIYRRGSTQGSSWVALAPSKADSEAEAKLR